MKIDIRFGTALAILAAVALFSTSAHAQWMRTSDQLGFYAGGGVAKTKVDKLCNDIGLTAITTCDDKDKSWKVSGGYQFHRNLAVEVGYVHLGKYSVSGAVGAVPVAVTAKVRAFEFLGVGILPLTTQFSAYAKVGGYRWDTDLSGPTGINPVGGTINGTDFTAGAGVKYDFTRNLAVRLEYQRYFDNDLNTLGAGVLWHFR
jgi:OOP family OmpA-OmpF porin